MLSVIVSTYNKPHQLRLVLEGLRHQRETEMEVIVADDGSTQETADLITEFAKRVPFRVEHVWQEDQGFRAARIRNLGVKAARGEQIIFLDGDCIPFPDFLTAHRHAATENAVLAGDRLFLDREPSAELTTTEVEAGVFLTRIPRHEYRRLRWRAVKNGFYRLTRLKERPKVVTANLSLSRQAFEDVNGLDERFVGWGHEDEDLRRRLVRRGYRIRSVYTTARVCHLWHRQVESFRGKVKFGDNIPYFRRGFFLSRCREGLEARPLGQLTIAWNGDTPDRTKPEVAIAWGRNPRFADAEIKILVRPETENGQSVPTSSESDADLHVLVGATETSGLVAAGEMEKPRLHLAGRVDPEDEEGRRALLAALEPII